MELTVMTFNVEEYYHNFDMAMSLTQLVQLINLRQKSLDDASKWLLRLEAHVFAKIKLVRSTIETYSPDILCIEEHSCGIDRQLLESVGLHSVFDESFLSQSQINEALLPDGYAFCCCPTGERIAKYSEIANLVVWRTSKLERTTPGAAPGALITSLNKPIPGIDAFFSPRSVACVELRPVEGGTPFLVCSTRLFGGRSEDSFWAAESEAGSNERVHQLLAIEDLINSQRFERGIPVIIAGDFNVMRKGFVEGDFSKASRAYVFGKTMIFSKAQLEKDYLESYVPFQIAVHDKLEELGYCSAYGRSDACPEMKTSRHGGCTDWIYSRGLRSRYDEQIICAQSGEAEWASDHNAVICTLVLPTVPRPIFGFGPGISSIPTLSTARRNMG